MNQLPKRQPVKLEMSQLKDLDPLVREIQKVKAVPWAYAYSYLCHQLADPAYAAMEDGRDKFEATVLGVTFSVRLGSHHGEERSPCPGADAQLQRERQEPVHQLPAE